MPRGWRRSVIVVPSLQTKHGLMYVS